MKGQYRSGVSRGVVWVSRYPKICIEDMRGVLPGLSDRLYTGHIPMQHHSAVQFLDASLRWHDKNRVIPAKAKIQGGRKLIPDWYIPIQNHFAASII